MISVRTNPDGVTGEVLINGLVAFTFTQTTFKAAGGADVSRSLLIPPKTLSGTAVDWSPSTSDGPPSWAKKVTLTISAASTNGTSNPLIQLGSTSILTSSYLSSGSSTVNGSSPVVSNYSAGFGLNLANASNSIHSQVVLTALGNNTWVCAGTFGMSNTFAVGQINGSVTLAGILDRFRFTTANGTDAYDGGFVSALYEG